MLLSTRETASRQYCCRQRTTTQTRLYAVTQQPASTGSAPSSLMNLVPWAIKNGIEFAKIKPAELPGYSGRCLVALGDIQPGECVVNVPVASALRVYPGCPTALPQIPQPVWSQLPWYVQLALTLLSEQQKGAASKWADYIRLLPGSVDVPVLWSQPQLQQLQCAYFVETVQQQQKDWQALQDQLTPYLDAAGISREQLMWALTVTRSRTFAAPYSPSTFGIQLGWLNNKAGGGGGQQQDQQQQHVMCPLLDLFNHRGDVQSECEFYSGLRSQSFRVVASQQWTRGQEVFINYGSGSNDALLQLYGFVEANNTDDRYIARALPAVLAEQGIAGSAAGMSELAEVVFTRQGLDAAAAAQLSALISSNASKPDPTGSPVVPYAALNSAVKSVCAAAVQRELSVLAVDAARDQELLQAFEGLPAKQVELDNKRADLLKANSRLEQMSEALQQQQPQDTADLAPDQLESQQQQQAELTATLQLCEDVCGRLSAEVDSLVTLVARWQGLVQQQAQVAVVYRLEKHRLLEGVLSQLC